MSLTEVILIAFALALDAFAVAVGAGSYYGKADRRSKFRLSFHFGFFQFIMPVIGWTAGHEAVDLIADYDHWIAFAILGFVGYKMIEHGIKPDEEKISKDVSKGMTLVALAVATSIDALAVGFGFGLVGGEILMPSLIIGVTASVMTLIGIRLGEKLRGKFGDKAQIAGGIVLILIGLRLLADHLGYL